MLEMKSIQMEMGHGYVIFLGDEDLFVAAWTIHQIDSRCVWKIKESFCLGGFISFEWIRVVKFVDSVIIDIASFEKEDQTSFFNNINEETMDFFEGCSVEELDGIYSASALRPQPDFSSQLKRVFFYTKHKAPKPQNPKNMKFSSKKSKFILVKLIKWKNIDLIAQYN